MSTLKRLLELRAEGEKQLEGKVQTLTSACDELKRKLNAKEAEVCNDYTIFVLKCMCVCVTS